MVRGKHRAGAGVTAIHTMRESLHRPLALPRPLGLALFDQAWFADRPAGERRDRTGARLDAPALQGERLRRDGHQPSRLATLQTP